MFLNSSLRKLRSRAVGMTIVLGLLFSGTVSAHNVLKSSSPADGARLESSPTAIALEFNGEVRLAKFVVERDGEPLAIAFEPSMRAAKAFSVPVAGLERGSYSVSFSILGADGHAVAGHFSFGVAADANPADH